MANNDIDELLLIGGAFDWITPLSAFVRDVLAGPVAYFGISIGLWDRGDIRRLLNSHSIAVWGLIYDLAGDMLMFTVHQANATAALAVLQEAGVPILYSPIETVDHTASAASFSNDTRLASLTIIEHPSIWRWLGKQILKLF